MKINTAPFLKKSSLFRCRLSKEVKWTWKIAFLIILVNFLLFRLIIFSSLKTILDQQNNQIARLNQIREELGKELKFYKEARIASEGKLFQQLSGLRDELANYKSQNKVLGEKDIEKKVDEAMATLEEWLSGKEIATTPGEFLRGMVKINDPKWESIDVYVEPKASSKIIGKAKYGDIYFYSQKENNWYKIEFSEEKYGWVQAQFLEELP